MGKVFPTIAASRDPWSTGNIDQSQKGRPWEPPWGNNSITIGSIVCPARAGAEFYYITLYLLCQSARKFNGNSTISIRIPNSLMHRFKKLIQFRQCYRRLGSRTRQVFREEKKRRNYDEQTERFSREAPLT